MAIDFDKTMIDIHTGGVWNGTSQELLSHVRPMFAQLLQAAMERNMWMAVVTFSPQIELISTILTHLVGRLSLHKIPIRGGHSSQWRYAGMGSQDGKQGHMASAVEELEQRFHADITKRSTVLLDDDAKNVRIALRNGVRAVWFNPKQPELIWKELQEML